MEGIKVVPTIEQDRVLCGCSPSLVVDPHDPLQVRHKDTPQRTISHLCPWPQINNADSVRT